MLSSLSCLFVGILLILSAETQAKVSPGHIKEETASYKSAAGTFEIKAVLREVTEPYTFQHLKVDYSVKQNGKFLHRSDLTGGSTWGCLYGDIHKLPTSVIEPLKIGTTQIGWSFNLLGICGNTTSAHYHWVVVWPDKDRASYFSKDFISKSKPVIQSAADERSATVWYLFQEWGNGGTAGSFFVPRVFALKTKSENTYAAFGDATLPTDIKSWPQFDGFTYTPASYIDAGIQAFDPNPIRAMIGKISDKEREHLNYVGLPSTAEDLKKLADGIEAAGPVIRQFHRPVD